MPENAFLVIITSSSSLGFNDILCLVLLKATILAVCKKPSCISSPHLGQFIINRLLKISFVNLFILSFQVFRSSRFTAGGTVFIPYLFGDDELAALFHEIDCYQYPRDPFRPHLLRTYFRMTYTCGLRPNEGRHLKRNEVDLNSGEVRIIETKWRKSRTIVMSEDMLFLARSYAGIRDAAFPGSAYFFPAPDGGPYSAQKMQGKFKWFFARTKPGIPKDLLPAVRVYDLRHRFATAVLNRWLDEKKELSSRLPYLQTYMGHKDWEATAYYIHLLPEKLVKSAGIDWEAMNGLIPRVELWEK